MTLRPSLRFPGAVKAQMVGQVVTVCASLGSTVILAHVMDRGHYGRFLALWTLVILASSLTRLGLKTSLQREIPLRFAAADEQAAHTVIRAAWWVTLITALLTTPALLGLTCLVLPTSSYGSPVGWLVIAITMGESSRTIGETVLRAVGMPRTAQMTGSPLRAILFLSACGLPLLLSAHWGLSTALLALLIANAATVFIQFVGAPLVRGAGLVASIPLRAILHLITLSPSFIMLDSAAIILSQGDVLIAGRTLPPPDLASYAIAVRVVTILAMPAVVVGTALAPRISYLSGTGASEELRGLVRLSSGATCGVTLLGTLIFALIGKPTLRIVYGAGFSASYQLSLILAVGINLNALFQLAGWLLVSIGRERVVLVVMTTVSVCELGIGYALSIRYGASALAWASTVASFVQSGILTRVYLRSYMQFFGSARPMQRVQT